MVSSSVSLSSGFSRTACAPARIIFTTRSVLGNAVTKITGGGFPSPLRRASTSVPGRSGNRSSNNTQSSGSNGAADRNSPAVANARTDSPAASSRKPRDLRTWTSSSTRYTIPG